LKPNSHPPKLWTRLFKWLCNDSYHEELQGDLEEAFFEHSATLGSAKANRLYKKEVIKMIRPSVLKRTFIKKPMRQPLLLHFLKIGFRNFKKNFSYALLNIIGFAAALAVCLFCINTIYSNQQLDKKFADGDRIYRINLKSEGLNGPSLSATTQISLYQKVQEAIPEAENIALIQNQTMYSSAYLKGAKRSLLGQGVNTDFFKIFNYDIVLGSKESLFSSPKNIIITKALMDKYYARETVIGSALGNYIISGVIENPTEVSHLDFEFLHSEYEDHTGSPFYSSWKVYFMQQLYIKLLPETEFSYIKDKFTLLSADINKELNNEEEGIHYEFLLEPLSDVASSPAAFNKGALLNSGGHKMVMTLIIIILLIATFNYTNLAIASTISRTKEVGIRKVLGTGKYSLVYQFLIETLMLSIIGFCFGLLIFKLLAPSVASFTDFAFQESLTLNQVGTFFLFALLMGFISGLIPGLFFSRISILALFRKSTNGSGLSVNLFKKGIMITQVTISLLVFTLGLLIFSQSRLILNQTTPFSGEQMVAIDLPSSDSLSTVLRAEIERINGVESVAGVSATPFIGSFGNYGVTKHHQQDKERNYNAVILSADSGFLSTFEKSIAWLGSKEKVKNRPYFLVNQAFAENMSDSIKSFDEATFSIGREYHPVLGIVKDLNLTDPMQAAAPAAILITQEYSFATLMIRVNEVSFARTLGEIGDLFKARYPNIDFHPVFLDDVLANRLSQFKNIVRALVFVFACIIAITLMGQIGMAMYQAKTREKEIGIRKVLGASFQQIIQLLLKSTFMQLVIAGLIACPAAYLIFQEVSPDFSIPMSLKFYHFAGAFLLFSVLISALVSSQTWKTIVQNPVDSLQNE